MSIPASHLLGRVTHELVDNSLIDSLTREIADETVAKTVPAFDLCPLAIF